MGVPAATFSFPTFFGPDSWIGSLLSRGVVGPPASALATVTLVPTSAKQAPERRHERRRASLCACVMVGHSRARQPAGNQ
jgi:hypothetical protein